MKILLTGSNGQLGNDFKKLFEKLHIKFISTDYEELDITDEKKLEIFFEENKDITHIINCAAYNDVDKAENDEKVMELNRKAPKNLALISKKIDAIFVTYSTDFVFNGEKEFGYVEEDEISPLSKYGESKAYGEKDVLTSYEKSYVIRTSWLFGTGNNNFTTQVINWSEKNKKLKIVDDQISAPTYSKDLALFTWKLIQTNKFGLYHFSNSGVASKYDQAKYILEKIKWNGILEKAKTEDFNLLAKRPKYSKLNSEKIENLLKEKIPTWQNAIDRFLEEMNS